MAKIQSIISTCIILAALIACHAILSSEGRQIKSMNRKETISTEGKKEILPPIGYQESAAAHEEDDFRPTTPGNSPGVGHSHHTLDNIEDVESKVVGTSNIAAGHSVGGFKDDFRPTSPGHSPGIGHKNAETKA
ncbi:hypothetical protein AB3S75_002024 [Citrus x aurantiifolia]